MKKTILVVAIIILVAIVFVVVLLPQQKSVDAGFAKICSQEESFAFKYYECESNNLGIKYRGGVISIGEFYGSIYYDADGNEVINCISAGVVGMPQEQWQKCIPYNDLKCEKDLFCNINCDLLNGSNRDTCYLYQVIVKGDQSLCTKIIDTQLREFCYS